MRAMKDSGVEWIGEVPVNWEIVPIKADVSIGHGSDPVSPGDIPVWGSGCEPFKTCGEHKNGPVVLLGRKGTLDCPQLVTGLYWNVDTAFDAKVTGKKISLKFFYYAATCVDIKPYMTNTAKPSMTQFDWGNSRIPRPPLSEQSCIVSYLDERCAVIDEDVAKRREVIEKLEEYRKSLIAHAVTKGLDPNTEMKDSGVDWIGEIPVSWIIAKAKSCLNFSNARNPGNQEAQVLSLYREYGVIPKSSRDDNHNRTSEDTSDYKNVRPGDLVINKMKAWQGSLGLSEYEGIVSPAYFVYRVNQKSIKGRYLHYLVRSDLYAQRWNALSYGIREGQWDLHREDFESDYLIFPPLSEQSQIVSYLDKRCAKIDEAISRQEQLIEKLGEYRKSIIHHAVTGKIDCTEA